MAELALMDVCSWSGEETCVFRLDRTASKTGISDVDRPVV